jgi:hypothetical protein
VFSFVLLFSISLFFSVCLTLSSCFFFLFFRYFFFYRVIRTTLNKTNTEQRRNENNKLTNEQKYGTIFITIHNNGANLTLTNKRRAVRTRYIILSISVSGFLAKQNEDRFIRGAAVTIGICKAFKILTQPKEKRS